MSNGSMLPPDIREQMDKQKSRAGVPTSPGGVGGRVPANAATAHQRQVAMGRGEEEPEQAAPPKEEEKVEEVRCPEPACGIKAENDWIFCARCGTDLIAGGAAKRLGVTITEDDVQDYLFKGYVVRDIKILGKHVATMRSSQTRDLKEIDSFIMNGDWSKDEKGNEHQVSDFFLRQMNALCITAMAVRKIDGSSIGESLADRVAWMEERGSAFVDMLATKVQLFNRAITEHLKKEDALQGS